MDFNFFKEKSQIFGLAKKSGGWPVCGGLSFFSSFYIAAHITDVFGWGGFPTLPSFPTAYHLLLPPPSSGIGRHHIVVGFAIVVERTELVPI